MTSLQRRKASQPIAFTAQDSRRGRTLLPRRPKDGQDRAITSGIWGMSVQSVRCWAQRPENGECQMSTISAVLPLKAYGRRYIDDPGRCHILLTSLAMFAPDDMFEDIFVVVPARERAHAEGLRRDWQSLPLVVIDEEEILPTFRDHPLTLNAGWYRQQLVKLCAANLSKTEFFITFDSDVILTKPI